MVGHFDQVVKAGALFAGLKALILPERDTQNFSGLLLASMTLVGETQKPIG